MIFENIDKKLEKLGFLRTRDNGYGVTYERYDSVYGYTQVVDIGMKKSGRHLLQSYSKEDTTSKGSLVVGLTVYETKLFLKKMKKKKLYRKGV